MRHAAFLTMIAIGAAILAVGAQAGPKDSGPSPFTIAPGYASTGGLDCNGYSAVQSPIKGTQNCTDPRSVETGDLRFEDNGHYIGHDEPAVQFLSSAGGSGNDVTWELTLPSERSLPATQTFENYPAFWLSMALCDPRSYPQGPCTPDSDSNTLGSGSAFLEMQFYPPGFSPFITQVSCDLTHWCASLHINSLECVPNLGCNPNCTETTNFAFIQKNGVPTGPAGPNNATNATYTPNNQTLLMNQGDHLKVTIHDTGKGLLNRIDDLTTGKSGFMVASKQHGFQSLDPFTCSATLFAFHPEFGTAKAGNWVSWAALQANIGASVEIGHFEKGANGDGDADDQPCFPGPTVAGCLLFALGGDTDFDGTSYQADWPDGTGHNATSLLLGPPRGPANHTYDHMTFQSTVGASEASCMPDGTGCTIPPAGAAFYPFWSLNAPPHPGDDTHPSSGCAWYFGNDIAHKTVTDFGGDAQYGESNVDWYFGQNSSGTQVNPCP